MLFTTDGELANALMHPSANIEREYMVRVIGEVDEDSLQRMIEGVMLDDGMARFTDIVDGGGDGINRWFYVVIMEGRNREVRRLWSAAGFEVSRLIRTDYGPVDLPRRLRRGQYKALTPGEVLVLYGAAGLPLPEALQRPRKNQRKVFKNRR